MLSGQDSALSGWFDLIVIMEQLLRMTKLVKSLGARSGE